MAEDTAKTSGRGRLWMRLALGVSLALNLLVLGVVIGALLRPGAERHGGAGARSMGVMLFRALPAEDRRALRAEMRGMAQRARPAEDAAGMGALDAALRAQPFDPAALDALVAQSNQRRHAWQQEMHQAWLNRVAGMSDGERAAYADRLQKAVLRKPGKGDRGTAD